jgi:hypothetical protein
VQSLVKATFKDNTTRDAVPSALKATHGILFFGTPHRGMFVESLAKVLAEDGQNQRLELLEEIKQGSTALKRELDEFVNVCDYYDLQVRSFYETSQTRELQSVRLRYLAFMLPTAGYRICVI